MTRLEREKLNCVKLIDYSNNSCMGALAKILKYNDGVANLRRLQ